MLQVMKLKKQHTSRQVCASQTKTAHQTEIGISERQALELINSCYKKIEYNCTMWSILYQKHNSTIINKGNLLAYSRHIESELQLSWKSMVA